MSCGGADDGTGLLSGFGGMVAGCATGYGVNVADGKDFAHREITKRRQANKDYAEEYLLRNGQPCPDSELPYPPPTSSQEIAASLQAKAAAMRKMRDRYPEPANKNNKRDLWVKYDRYAQALDNEANKFASGKRKMPDGATWDVWQNLAPLMKEFAEQNRCEACGQYVSPSNGGAHPCTSAQPEVEENSPAPTPVAESLNLRDAMVASSTPQLIVPGTPEWGRGVAGPAEVPVEAPRIILPNEPPAKPSVLERAAGAAWMVRCPRCKQFTEVGGHFCSSETETIDQILDQLDDDPTEQIPPFPGPDVDELGEPIDQPRPVAEPGPSRREIAKEIAREFHEEVGDPMLRFTSRILLNPKGWRMLAPYAGRAALIAAPLVLFAGTALGPFAIAASIYFMFRARKWLKNRPYEDRQALIDHYNKPLIWQRIAARRRARRAPVEEQSWDSYAEYGADHYEPDPHAASDPYPLDDYYDDTAGQYVWDEPVTGSQRP